MTASQVAKATSTHVFTDNKLVDLSEQQRPTNLAFHLSIKHALPASATPCMPSCVFVCLFLVLPFQQKILKKV